MNNVQCQLASDKITIYWYVIPRFTYGTKDVCVQSYTQKHIKRIYEQQSARAVVTEIVIVQTPAMKSIFSKMM
jgi:hypothetical protein